MLFSILQAVISKITFPSKGCFDYMHPDDGTINSIADPCG
jgi:hypothetical protein